MERFTLVATERDGLEIRAISIDIDAQDGMRKSDVIEAVKSACTEYCKTREGFNTYDGNCNSFNYGDFEAYVPNEICEKYGIKKVGDDRVAIENLEFDEQLVDESEILEFWEPEEEEEEEKQ